MGGKYEGGFYLSLNGYICPPCKPNFKMISSQNVDAGRNLEGTVVGQLVGRVNHKLDSFEWSYLPQKEWYRIKNILHEFYISARFFEASANDFITIRIYPGDISAEPLAYDNEGRVTEWLHCKVNLIDRGEPEVIRG